MHPPRRLATALATTALIAGGSATPAATTASAAAIQWPASGGTNQRWKVAAVSGGTP